MKGNLIANTLILGVIIILYYASMMAIQYIFSAYDIIFAGIIDWRTNYNAYAGPFMNIFIYLIIPACIVIGFIIHTKPQQETIGLGGFR